MERENEHKTSAVHFLRFELTPEMKRELFSGAALAIGIEHPQYSAHVADVSPQLRAALMNDLRR